MGFNFFGRKKEEPKEELNLQKDVDEALIQEADTVRDLMLSSNSKIEVISREQALNIPAFSFARNFISEAIAGLEIKLYKIEDNKIIEIKDDNRVKLLNDDTGDLLTGYQMKKAVIEDSLLNGSGHIYINKEKGKIKSLHYVKEKEVGIQEGTDPIFKDIKLTVQGKDYEEFDFINVTRKTENGVKGIGIVEENNVLLSTIYHGLIFENVNMRAGGIKKGVVKSAKKLSTAALNELKAMWRKLYGNDSKENCMVLNEGLDFKELQQTFVEMQLLENKKVNSKETVKLFSLPPALLDQEDYKEEIYNLAVKMGVMPPLNAFLSAINKNLLKEKEKENMYFGAELKDLLKGDIEKRYKAYEIGLKNGFLQRNDVRYAEDLAPFEDFDFISIGLGEVLYNTKTKEIFIPNTGQAKNISDLKGGDINENRD